MTEKPSRLLAQLLAATAVLTGPAAAQTDAASGIRAALERGAVRVEGAIGGVENGPEQWRRSIEEALRQC